jgi:16S rRNA (guanine966-N2)-methyltransferase
VIRIVAGEYRGRKIATLPDSDQSIRPTSDRAREAIFNILSSNYGMPAEARVLDLCCGTGALGLESLSRGALHATFIDNNNTALRLVKETAQKIDAMARSKILMADAGHLPEAPEPCDLIFCDPPYGKDIIPTALKELVKKGYAKPGTLLVLETGKNEQLSLSQGFRTTDTRQYGIAKIWFVEMGE